MKWKRIRKWLLIITLVYIAGGVALYLLQDAILFHPVQLKRDHRFNFSIPHQDISIAINDKDTLSLVRFTVADPVPKGIVLYFHGNKKISAGMQNTPLISPVMVMRS